jgi:hypothetical protein
MNRVDYASYGVLWGSAGAMQASTQEITCTPGMNDKQHHALPSMTVSNQHLCIGDVFNAAFWLTYVQGYLLDTTQAALSGAPDAAANNACPALHSRW